MGKQLFESEDRILDEAQTTIARAVDIKQEMLAPYSLLTNEYKRLLRITKKAFYISDRQGKALRMQQAEIQNLLDNANQGFLTFAKDLKVDRQYSVECIRVFGHKIAGLSITSLLTQGNEASKVQLEEVLARCFSEGETSADGLFKQFPAQFRIKDRDIQVECKLLGSEMGHEPLIMMILTDITEKILAEEKIHYLSYHDKMTGLYNRAYIETVLPEYETAQALPISCIIIDMNGLKLINDVFGHQQGDVLIITMANILMKCCRPNDRIARWGGDEFLILLPQTDAAACRQFCESFQNACVQTKNNPIQVSAAIGWTTKTRGPFRFSEMFSEAENMMYSDKLAKRGVLHQSFITSLEALLYSQCYENDGHGMRVERLATEFISFLGLSLEQPQIKTLLRLARLHDIGKVAINSDIWGRRGELSDDEWDIVKNHSDVGYRLASSIGEASLAEAILLHHEWWDGTGYPNGLKADQIPFSVRVFSLIDMYDVLTHDRPYRLALEKQEALREISSENGTHFDPAITAKFLEFMKD
ncbi:MAG: metal dependent phosphohydrolase [Firmicutes bacterium]|nr:metal dependent phosphohydrolase [Bacillota bacterium]